MYHHSINGIFPDYSGIALVTVTFNARLITNFNHIPPKIFLKPILLQQLRSIEREREREIKLFEKKWKNLEKMAKYLMQ